MLPKISILSALIPIILFLLFCSKNSSRGLWVIFIYCIASFLFDVFLSTSLWAIEHTYLVWNIFAILEFSLLTYFFYVVIKERIVRILILVFLIFYLIIFFLFLSSNDDHFNSVLNAIGSVIFLSLSIIFFILSMRNSEASATFFSPIFLIVIALLLYISSTLFLYIIASRLTEKEMEQYWSINHISNILTNLIFSAAFFLNRSQHKNPSTENAVDFTRLPDDR